MADEKRCKDCVADGVTTKRAAPHPGPRCVTHHRAVRKVRKGRAHELRVEKVYGITGDEYQEIYDSQDGSCFVCQKAKGISKKLAVDHEHDKDGCDHEPDVGCRNCVRCLACTTCNRIILGRYDVDALARAITVLVNPPAQKVLNGQMQ